MKELVGKKARILLSGGIKVDGIVMQDTKQFLLVKVEGDEFAWRLVKSQISAIQPLEKIDTDGSLLLLYCENPSIRCPGVQYLKESDTPTVAQKDFTTFMQGCPLRQNSCRCGSRGDIRTIDINVLSKTLHGNLFGDYPDEKGTK